ncbi:MAG: helix-hairpin-helix domain-containing protein [Ignavibacteriae bacterium]|nr:helix-hairpin-helix domain-containing protein [Ignavibacteriota bacterium]
MSRFVFVAGSALFFGVAIAQTPADSLIEQQTEVLLESVESETDNSEIIDQLDWLKDHPINLNKAGRKDLASIPTLTAGEIDIILQARKKAAKFSSVEELAQLHEQGENILSKIRSYVFVPEANQSRSASLCFTSRVIKDLQPREGFQSGTFAGSAIKSYSRLTYEQSENLQAGILTEKDAGEKLGDSFLSGYVNVRNAGVLADAVVGDYVVEAGQGLVLWRATSYGKGSETMSIIKKNSRAIHPYRSADEFNFFRGAAATGSFVIGSNTLNVTALYSSRSLAASGDSSAVTSFYEEGFFRTESEKRKLSAFSEKVIGGRLEFESGEDWSVGSTMYRATFSKPVAASRLYELEGSLASAVGIDAEVRLGWLSPRLAQIVLFGEAASTGPHSLSYLAGVIFNLSRSASAALIYRNYAPQFVPLHSSAFGERSEAKNERGLYIGVDFRPLRWLRVSAYLDQFTFPWRTFDNPFPTSGKDLLVQAEGTVLNGFVLALRYSNKQSEFEESIDESGLRQSRVQVDRRQEKFRLTAAYQVSKKLRLRGRVESTTLRRVVSSQTETGILIYNDLQFAFSSQLRFETRLAFFHTDSYDTRLYEYENDLRGVFANPAMYGKGRRWYALLNWQALKVVNLAAKYSLTQKDGVASLGSGDSEIHNDIDNRLSMQIEILF